jgi:hypothetical protein
MPKSASSHLSPKPICRFIVAKMKLFCHKPGLHRPAERAAVAMVMRVCSIKSKNQSIYNALTSILAAKAPFRRDFLRQLGELNAQVED